MCDQIISAIAWAICKVTNVDWYRNQWYRALGYYVNDIGFLPPSKGFLNPQPKVDKHIDADGILELDRKVQALKKNLSSFEKKEIERALLSSKFQDQLLYLIGTTRQTQAINLTLKAFVVLATSPKFKDIEKKFLDFSAPLPPDSISNGLSFEYLSFLLDLKELLSVFCYIEQKGFNIDSL